MRSDVKHMLSFDVEEYFQVQAAVGRISREQWDRFEPRLPASVDRILQTLSDNDTSATFFVLGWVARRHKTLIRRIVQCGHEIGSHGMDHRMLSDLGPDAFRRDLIDSRRLLEDLTGRPVLGYRAPTFSLTRQTAWAVDILAGEGFRYDASVFPVHHDRYGVPQAPRWTHRAVGPAGGSVIEVPPLTIPAMSANWPVGGGGYLRLLPVRILDWALHCAERAGRSAMIYLHPWEMDPHQPSLPIGTLQRWRHRVGLHTTEKKLRHLLRRFRFSSVERRLESMGRVRLERFVYGRRNAIQTA